MTDQVNGPVPDAVRVAAYADPTVPSGRLVVVMLSEGAEIVMVSGLVALAPPAPTTFAVKLDVPAVVGVPPIAPVEALRDRPAGSEPEARDQVNGPVPEAVRVAAYAEETVPLGRLDVVIEIVPAVTIVMARALVADLPPAPTTLTLKVFLPVAVGVPEMTPVDAFSVSPVGSVPDPTTMDHVNGPVPPAVRVAE